MIKEFDYTSSKGTNHRKVLVVKETDSFIEGLDLLYLTSDESKYITEKYKDLVPTAESALIEDWDSTWNKAWRKFLKSKMI